jgi:hypothetical protein
MNPTDIIRSMARTLEVLAYTAWCDAWDEAGEDATDGDGRGRPDDCVSAGAGEDWFDVAPEIEQGELEDYGVSWERDAAILYGRIWQAWGADPALVLHWNGHGGTESREKWGHYAVMCAVGHGVAWEDTEDELHGALSDTSRTFTMLGRAGQKINIETPVWLVGIWPVPT